MAWKTTRSAGGVVLGPDMRVLVVSQHGDSWSLPKGHIEPDEDLLAAARREIYEEAGVSDLEMLRPLGEYSRYRIAKGGGEDESELKMITFFLFRTSQTTLAPVDSSHPEARWVEMRQVADLLTHPKDKAFFVKSLGIIESYAA